MGIFRKEAENPDTDTVILTCECLGGDMETNHAVTFKLWNMHFTVGGDTPTAAIYTHCHVPCDTFWYRLCEGIRFIFGRGDLHGPFIETLIAREDAMALRDFFDKYIQITDALPGDNTKA